MTLKTPKFWYRDQSRKTPFIEYSLAPLSAIYNVLHGLHQSSNTPQKASVPVICIGNIVAGGTGKTPTALALLKLVREQNIARNPHFLIRGYGGAAVGSVLVDLKQHNAWDVGDEALILAAHAPTVAGADRAASAKVAYDNGADLIIMDDGLQNPGIHKDIKLVVINGEMGFGNHKLIPAGPLRQSLRSGLKIADGFIIIGQDKRNIKAILPADKPLITAQLRSDNDDALDKDQKYLAFAGLGYPDKFFNFLREQQKINLVDCIAFADHYPYEEKDVKILGEKAAELNAVLLTTEKDFMRLPSVDGIEVKTIPVHLKWDSETTLIQLLKNISVGHENI